MITGGFGGVNLGDEAILFAITRMLRGVGQQADEVLLFGAGNEIMLEGHRLQGLKFFNFFDFSHSLPLIFKSHVLFNFSTRGRGIIWPLSYASLLILMNRLSGKQPVLFAVGADRPTHFLSRLIIRFFFRWIGLIICRDEHSKAVFLELGIPARKLAVTADSVFSLRGEVPFDIGAESSILRVVVVPGRDPKYMASQIASMTTIVARLLKQERCEIVIMPHDLREEYDVGAARAVLEAFQDERLTYFQPENLQETFQIYQSADVVISNRMHPLILGAVHNAVPIAAAYSSSKVSSLVELTDFLSLGKPEQVSSRLGELDAIDADWLNRERLRLVRPLEALKQESRRSAEYVRNLWGH